MQRAEVEQSDYSTEAQAMCIHRLSPCVLVCGFQFTVTNVVVNQRFPCHRCWKTRISGGGGNSCTILNANDFLGFAIS